MYSLLLTSCVKQACTEKSVEAIAARHSLCTIRYYVPGKNVNINLKRTLSESSEPSSRMSYPRSPFTSKSLSLPTINSSGRRTSAIWRNTRFLLRQKELQLTDRCMHQMQLLFTSGAELGFARQFHWEYVYFGADLRSAITHHFSKTSQRIYSNNA